MKIYGQGRSGSISNQREPMRLPAMNVINIDLTPSEARELMGLPILKTVARRRYGQDKGCSAGGNFPPRG